MLRSIMLVAMAAVMMSPTAATADNKSDCEMGVAMIKAELKKKHPEPVLVTLRKALSDAELEVAEKDWSECMNTSGPRAPRSASNADELKIHALQA